MFQLLDYNLQHLQTMIATFTTTAKGDAQEWNFQQLSSYLMSFDSYQLLVDLAFMRHGSLHDHDVYLTAGH